MLEKMKTTSRLALAALATAIVGCGSLDAATSNIRDAADRLAEGIENGADSLDPVALKEVFRAYRSTLEENGTLEEALRAADARARMTVDAKRPLFSVKASGGQDVDFDIYITDKSGKKQPLFSGTGPAGTNDHGTRFITPATLAPLIGEVWLVRDYVLGGNSNVVVEVFDHALDTNGVSVAIGRRNHVDAEDRGRKFTLPRHTIRP